MPFSEEQSQRVLVGHRYGDVFFCCVFVMPFYCTRIPSIVDFADYLPSNFCENALKSKNLMQLELLRKLKAVLLFGKPLFYIYIYKTMLRKEETT